LIGSTLTSAHSLFYTQRLGQENFSLSFSIVGTKMPGLPQIYLHMASVTWHHQVQTVPSFVIPEHHGVIAGIIFRDNDSKGTYEPGAALMANAVVVLDGSRRVETGADGSYRFSHVPVGKHQIAVSYRSAKPTFFSTPSTVEVTETATANFGIGFSLSSLIGRVVNDAGQGVMGVTALIRNNNQHWTPCTDGDGTFVLHQLSEGEYDVEIQDDSVPAGYLTAQLEPQHVTVAASSPGNAIFTVRASRSISGKVLTYDAPAGKYLPVAAQVVTLKEVAKKSTTDASGRYLFRDLPAGSYTVVVVVGSREVTKPVKLPPSPIALTNIDLQISERAALTDAPEATLPTTVQVPQAPQAPVTNSAPIATPVVPSSSSTPEVKQPALARSKELNRSEGSHDAELHNRTGRQKLAAGRYQEAIAELNEAIRLSPSYALAYNARGFTYYQMHDFKHAIQDLDKAIELNPNYANAYHNRGVARKAAGDLTGAEADFRRER
jgi:hypothetical protein